MTPWKDLTPERMAALRDAYAQVMAHQTGTCALAEKISRFAAWLAPQGISFDADDLPRRNRGQAGS